MPFLGTLILHTAAFSQRGHDGLIKAAKAMAMTAIELLANPALAAQARREFGAAVA